jgi:hypothetical protein
MFVKDQYVELSYRIGEFIENAWHADDRSLGGSYILPKQGLTKRSGALPNRGATQLLVPNRIYRVVDRIHKPPAPRRQLRQVLWFVLKIRDAPEYGCGDGNV